MDNAEQRHLDALVRAGGGIYAGVVEGVGESPGLVYFHDPQTRSTLALPLAGVTSEQVRHQLAESRESFAVGRSASGGDRNAHGKGWKAPGASSFVKGGMMKRLKAFFLLSVCWVGCITGLKMLDATESTRLTMMHTDAQLREEGVDPTMYRLKLWYAIQKEGGTLEQAKTIANAEFVPYERGMTPDEVASNHRIGLILVLLSIAVPIWIWRKKLVLTRPGLNLDERARARAEIAARKAGRK